MINCCDEARWPMMVFSQLNTQKIDLLLFVLMGALQLAHTRWALATSAALGTWPSSNITRRRNGHHTACRR